LGGNFVFEPRKGGGEGKRKTTTYMIKERIAKWKLALPPPDKKRRRGASWTRHCFAEEWGEKNPGNSSRSEVVKKRRKKRAFLLPFLGSIRGDTRTQGRLEREEREKTILWGKGGRAILLSGRRGRG